MTCGSSGSSERIRAGPAGLHADRKRVTKMKNALIILVVVDLLLIFAAGIRLNGATETPRKNEAPSTETTYETEPGFNETPAAQPGAGAAFVDAMTTTGGDVPPGLEGAIGGNRPTYEVDVDGNPYGGQDAQEQGLDDAKDKIKALPFN